MRMCATIALLTGLLLGPGTGWAESADEAAALAAQQASAALLQGRVPAAIKHYGDALQQQGLTNDRRASLLNDRGLANWRAGQIKASIDDFNMAVTLLPENPTAYNNRGNVLLSAGFVDEAIKDFERALLLAPGYAGAYNNRANAYRRLGKTDLALADFAHAIRLTPQATAPLAGRGKTYLSLGRPYAALRDFNRAVALDAQSGIAYRHRADVLLVVDNAGSAVEDLSRAIAFDANNSALYVARGRAYLLAKNMEGAIKDFSKAIELSPNMAAAYAQRGLVHARLSQRKEALEDLSKAIELDHRLVTAYIHRAWAYRTMNEPETGLRDIDRALKLEPNNAEAHKVRGQLLEALQRPTEALADYRKALTLDPRSRESREAVERLTKEPSPQPVVVEGAGKDDWQVYRAPDGSHFAQHPTIAKFNVPLELPASGAPRIIGWEMPQKSGEVGVLRYEMAEASAVAGPTAFAVVVDTREKRILGVEPDRLGETKSTWTWETGKLVVAAVDGLTNEYKLPEKAPAVAEAPAAKSPPPRRRQAAREYAGDSPFNPDGTRSYSNRSRPQRSSQPKTLFDLLFGN